MAFRSDRAIVGGSHFSDAVLKKLDNALSQLPIEHLQGTYLKNISSGDGIGAASAYTQDSDTAGHIGIVAPGMPEWIYAMLNKGVGWQRKLMDSGAIESLTTGVSKESDKKLGIERRPAGLCRGIRCSIQGESAELDGAPRDGPCG